MNIEGEIKGIFRTGINTKVKVEQIANLTNFQEQDILKAIKNAGPGASEIYSYLLKLDKKRHDK